MKVTLRKLKALKETDIKKLWQLYKKTGDIDWAKWVVARLLKKREDKIRYAIYAAEQVIGSYEEVCPDNKRPREAIEAAKKTIANDTKESRAAARAAADSAAFAAYAAYAADAADSAAYAAYDAARAAANAAYVAYDAAYDARTSGRKTKIKIINYGLKLLTTESKET